MPPKKPSQASGQAPAPSKNQRRKPKKPKVVSAVERTMDAIGKLNPFD